MFESVQQLFLALVGIGGNELTVPPVAPAAPAPEELSTSQLVERIAAAERLVHALQGVQRRDIAAFARARMAADDDLSMIGSRLRGRTVGTELALALNTSMTAGASRATLAAAATEDHPALSALAERGEVSEYALRWVTRETEVLPPEQRRVVDAQLADDVTSANHLTPARLRQAAARRTIAVDPYAATRRCEAARSDRAFGVMDPRDGTATLWARLRAEEALAVHQSIDTTARRLRAEGDERSLANLRCDLLVQVTTGAEPSSVLSDVGASPAPAATTSVLSPSRWPLGSAAVADDPPPDDAAWDSYPDTESLRQPSSRAPKRVTQVTTPPMPVPAQVELQVVLSASTLLGLDQEPALLRGYGAIPASIAAQILDSANGTSRQECSRGDRSNPGVLVRRLLCDPVDGRLVGMDTRSRRYTGPLRQFTTWRDQACRLSDAPIADIDHITRYVDCGLTTATNGQGLSKNSHVLRDHPQVSVRTRAPLPPPPLSQPPTAMEPAAAAGASHELSQLRELAPDVEWTMPTGHTYLRRPPPALGWGSGATPHDPPPPPDPDTAARMADESARELRRDLALLRHRVAREIREQRLRREQRMRGHPSAQPPRGSGTASRHDATARPPGEC